MPESVEVPRSAVRTDDWPVQATDSIVKVVGTVHDKVTGPITTVARGIVYGLFATVLGTTALLLFVIAMVRVIDNYLPDAVFGEDHVWAAYLIMGVPLCLVAMVLWWKRNPPERHA